MEEGIMDAQAAFVTHDQAAEVTQPGEGALDLGSAAASSIKTNVRENSSLGMLAGGLPEVGVERFAAAIDPSR